MQKIINRIIAGAVIAQLLSIIFRQSFTIGGEIFIPALVLLIRQLVIKISAIFAGIKSDFKESNVGKTNETPEQIPENVSEKARFES